MLEGRRRPVCARLCAGIRPEHGGAAHELHLWTAAIRHGGSGMARAFHAALYPWRTAYDLWRWTSGQGCLACLRRGEGMDRGARQHSDRARARLQPRRRSRKRDQLARTDPGDRDHARNSAVVQFRRMAAGRSALVRVPDRRARRRCRLEAASAASARSALVARLAGRTIRFASTGGQGVAGMTRVALINPDWQYDGSIYFGCRSPHLPLELGISQQLLDRAGHQTLLLDAHMFGLSISDVVAELETFRPDMVVVTTAPTYLFWRCAPPELRVPQQLTLALRDSAPILVAVGPHGSTTPRAALGKLQVDFVVMGECEATLLRLANGERDIPGICCHDGGQIRVNGGPQAAPFID